MLVMGPQGKRHQLLQQPTARRLVRDAQPIILFKRQHGTLAGIEAVQAKGLRYTLDLNLNSVIYSNRAAIRQFLKQGSGGVILNMASVLGYSPSAQFFASHAYAAAKAGIIGFSKSIAAYYAPQNIRVNVIAPALVETPMSQRAVSNENIMNFVKTKQPLDGGRVGQPEDCDAAALLLLSPDSQFITGQVLAVDGGWTVSEGQILDARC